jgi:hypothetical protein
MDTLSPPRFIRSCASFLASSDRIVSISRRARSISFFLTSSFSFCSSMSFLARANSARRDASSFSLRTLSSERSSLRRATSALRRERARRSALAAATSSANWDAWCAVSSSGVSTGAESITRTALWSAVASVLKRVRTSSADEGWMAVSRGEAVLGPAALDSSGAKGSSIKEMVSVAWSTRMRSSPRRAQPMK